MYTLIYKNKTLILCKSDIQNKIIRDYERDKINPYRLLYSVSSKGYDKVVKYLINQNIDIKANDNGALRHASEKGHLELVKYLVSQGGDITADNNFALKFSVCEGHTSVVEYLLSLNKDIKVINQCIVLCSRNNQLHMIKYLLDYVKDDIAMKESIENASFYGYMEIVKYIMEIENKNYTQALCNAAIRGNLQIVKYLISKGIDITTEATNVSELQALKYLSYKKEIDIDKKCRRFSFSLILKDKLKAL